MSKNARSDGTIFVPDSERTGRLLDRLRVRTGGGPVKDPETGMRFLNSLDLSMPVYLGDMSFGALSGVPNIAIARAAQIESVVAGTGEGGLLPEVSGIPNITVQWASARFGVTADTLSKGSAIVIKIGQGAKPGIGGHLPASKVTEAISRARRIPVGIDAISPAPHHDIYSIEDLGRRIRQLRTMTGKPVLVKVAATNYIPYIALGVARMGGAGIIIDGYGAGTGAAPEVVRNNIGLPVEVAVASAHNALVSEGLRDRFLVIAGGRISTPEDMFKLMALGADMAVLGTATLIAMGCVMVHRCHLGFCPALITNRLSDRRGSLSLEFATGSVVNFLRGWRDEMCRIMEASGVASLEEVVGNRSLLKPSGILDTEASLIGLEEDVPSEFPPLPVQVPLPQHMEEHILRLSGLSGNSPAHPPISSMGSNTDPHVSGTQKLLDYLRIDGAQVTRPSVDPYREEIDTSVKLRGGPCISIPCFTVASPAEASSPYMDMVSRSMQVPVLKGQRLELSTWCTDVEYLSTDWRQQILDALDEGRRFFVVQERDEPAPLVVARIDEWLTEHRVRGDAFILAISDGVHCAEDVFKMVCLGADLVSINVPVDVVVSKGGTTEHIENLLAGIQKEISLLSGAAGVTSVGRSLRGSRELLRAVGLPTEVCQSLGVKAGGE
ncbi:glutamate synthase [Thermogymnomonas acidicola]|uniref:Archaeal glutamate synthase [NADPH] n=2 Tax=Thermogymnomonas acidicola TaxID=399579 RepID=A0AA37FA73_9ARCH|nr:glutamate synthase [Thermogymnomonas acidicola]